jgi:hypothetical protein
VTFQIVSTHPFADTASSLPPQETALDRATRRNGDQAHVRSRMPPALRGSSPSWTVRGIGQRWKRAIAPVGAGVATTTEFGALVRTTPPPPPMLSLPEGCWACNVHRKTCRLLWAVAVIFSDKKAHGPIPLFETNHQVTPSVYTPSD